MATRVGCGGIRLNSFNSSSPKPPIRRKDLGDISYRSRITALLSQILLLWQQVSVRVKLCWQYSMTQPRNPPPYRLKDLADISSRSRVGDVENARNENTRHENAAPKIRGENGKSET